MGSLMSSAASAISGLNSFSLLPNMNSFSGLGLGNMGMNYFPMKGFAMSMSSNYPTFAGPKVQATLPSTSSSQNGFGGGLRSKLSNLLNGRFSTLSLSGLSGLGSSNGGLLGMMGFR